MNEIDKKDLAPIIEIATEEMEDDADKLSEAQVDEIAAELGISSDYVDEAQGILEEQRQIQADEAAQAQTLRTQIAWVAAGFGVICLIAAIVGYNGLNSTLTTVEEHRAQVINVTERQTATLARLATQPHSKSKAAELAGAENRVRIERKRYDEQAAIYNRQVGAFPASLWRGVFGLPNSVPLSHEGSFKGGTTQ